MAYLYCPLCGKPRKWENDAVCGECFQRYDALPQPRASLLEWTCQEFESLLPELETLFAKAKELVDAIKQRQYEVAVAALRKSGATGSYPKAEWEKMMKVQHERWDQIIWEKMNGPRLFAERATLQARIFHGHTLGERVEVERTAAREREKILDAAAELDLDEIMAQLDAGTANTRQANEPSAVIVQPKQRSRHRNEKRRRGVNDDADEDADEDEEE